MEALAAGDPRQIGPYRLQARLGAGGMGRVFLGSTPTGRKVAVKLLKVELADSAEFRVRFAREMEAARQVSGLHTAQVIEADPQADPPWLATAYIAGPTLHAVVREDGPLTASAVKTLGAGLAEGLAAIHDCGLVHRDLKPSNVIMAADGIRIIDFGIARAIGSSTLTETGALVGTYAYMSPEQIRADAAGTGSDVFALGCVLGFAATGDGPFDATSIPAIMHRILSEPPQLNGIPDDLREVIDSCLAKDVADRPSTNEIMTRLTGDALDDPAATIVDISSQGRMRVSANENFESEEAPDSAPPAGRISRRAVISGVVAATAAAIAVPTVLLWPKSVPAPKAGDKPASDSSGSSDPFDGVPKPSTTPYAGLNGHKGGINSVAFNEDGTLLASGGDDKIARVWDVATGEQTAEFIGHTDPIRAVVFNDGYSHVVSGGDDRTIRFWALDDEWYDDLGKADHGIVSLASMFGEVASGLENGDIQLWNYNLVFVREEFTGARSARTVAMGFHDGKTLLASGDIEGDHSLVRVWNGKTGKLLHELAGHTDSINSVAVSSEVVASASSDKTIRLWDLSTGKTTTVLKGHTDAVRSVAFQPYSNVLASAGADGTIRIWDVDTGSTTATLLEAPQEIKSMAYSPDGTTVAVCGGDAGHPDSDAITLWRIQ